MPAKNTLLGQLAALGIHPRKGLGQNFLVDPAHRARIVAAAELGSHDTVLEIGPGPGVLTELLLEQAGQVVAVELDERLLPFLLNRFAGQAHFHLQHGDILKTDVGKLMRDAMRVGEQASYKVVANLPYYITGAVIPHVLEAEPAPELTVLTVQREVAERMVARPPDMSLLAVGVQLYAEAQIVDRIPAGAFYPVPKVDSAVVRLRQRREPASDVARRDFFRVVKAGYSQPRKQLRNSLAGGLGVASARAAVWLTAAGIAPERRAETLTLAEWGALARVVTGDRDRTGESTHESGEA